MAEMILSGGSAELLSLDEQVIIFVGLMGFLLGLVRVRKDWIFGENRKGE